MSYTRYCPRCDREWRNVPDHVIELYHHCKAPRNRVQRRPTLEETRFEWAKRLLGGIADNLDARNEADNE